MRGPLSRRLLTSLTSGQRGHVRTLFKLGDAAKPPASVPLTRETFDLKRGPYAEATPDDLSALKDMVHGRMETDQDDLLEHNTDWLRTLRGQWPLGFLVCLSRRPMTSVSDLM